MPGATADWRCEFLAAAAALNLHAIALACCPLVFARCWENICNLCNGSLLLASSVTCLLFFT
jgi:hypothetical protein